MTERSALVLIAIVAVVAAVVAVVAGPNFGVALFMGGAAALGAGAIAVLVLSDRVRRAGGRATVVNTEILVTLRAALSSGSIGRQRVIAAVQSVELGFGVKGGPSIGIDEERRLVELSPEKFRAWLSEQLDRLERET